MAIHNAKSAFYSFRQHDLSNSVYLQRFNNLVDIATSLGGNLHDDAISSLISEDKFGVKDPRDASLTPDEMSEIQETAKEMYLAVVLIQHADARRFKKLQDDLTSSHESAGAL